MRKKDREGGRERERERINLLGRWTDAVVAKKL